MLNKKTVLSCVAAGVLAAACATVPVTGRQQLNLIPNQEILSMSFSSYQELMQSSKLSQNKAQVAQLRAIGGRIAAAAEQFLRDNKMAGEIPNYKWEFNLIDDKKTVNAFCMPGGKVAFYTGILPVTQDDNGIAVVMGHEVAHAIARHGNERMSQALLAQLGGTTLSIALQEKPEQTRELWLAAYGVGTNVGILLPYSRKQEIEADRIGLSIMARAGYDPRTAIPFWERMSKLGGGNQPPEFLSTHPANQRRIEDIKKEIPEAMKYYKGGK
jgi:predicted Zn-dependent protease